MAEADDLFLGRYVLAHKLVAREALLEALFEIAAERGGKGARPYARPLGVILATRGLLTDGQLVSILSERIPEAGELTASQLNDMDFGSLVRFAGIASRAQVQECLLRQRQAKRPGRPSRRLGEILIERGLATAAQVQRLLAYHRKEIYRCTACDSQFNVKRAIPGKAYSCPKCDAPLKPAVLRPVQTDSLLSPAPPPVRPQTEKAAPRPAPPSPESGAEFDRAVALYVVQKSLVTRPALRQTQQLQAEVARYGLDLPLIDLLERTSLLSWQQAKQLRTVDFKAMTRAPGWLQQAVPGYRVVRRIAGGGFATVFAAEPVFGGPTVALKILHRDRMAEQVNVERFQHEAALLQQFNHPNIVRCFDAGEHEGVHYMALEYVDGESLYELVRQRGTISPRDTIAVLTRCSEALRYMHVEGWLHRDIKPDNVLIGRGAIKLCDLGLAGAIEEVEHASMAVGTCTYISPEQARGEGDLKCGTDIYSLGLVAYFMLTGHEAFTGPDAGLVLSERFQGGVKMPDIAAMQAPARLKALVARMLDPDRLQRFATYNELLEELAAM